MTRSAPTIPGRSFVTYFLLFGPSALAIIAIVVLAAIAGCDRAQQAPEADAKPEAQAGNDLSRKTDLSETDPPTASNLADRMTYHRAVDAAVWAMPLMSFKFYRDAPIRPTDLQPELTLLPGAPGEGGS